MGCASGTGPSTVHSGEAGRGGPGAARDGQAHTQCQANAEEDVKATGYRGGHETSHLQDVTWKRVPGQTLQTSVTQSPVYVFGIFKIKVLLLKTPILPRHK